MEERSLYLVKRYLSGGNSSVGCNMSYGPKTLEAGYSLKLVENSIIFNQALVSIEPVKVSRKNLPALLKAGVVGFSDQPLLGVIITTDQWLMVRYCTANCAYNAVVDGKTLFQHWRRKNEKELEEFLFS